MNNQSPIAYNHQLDGLRCLAVISVMICHFIQFEKSSILSHIPFGKGVTLFFVLSGYLITKILLVNKNELDSKNTTLKQTIKNFYIRRSLRIFPIYYLTIFILIIIDFQNTREVWAWITTYTTNFYLSLNYPYIGSFNHLWSLAVEEQFYLIWPFIILLTPIKHIEKSIITTIITSLIFKTALYYHSGPTDAINALTISCADSLGLGSLIAYWSIFRPAFIRKISYNKWLIPASTLPYISLIVFPKISKDIMFFGGNFFFSLFATAVIIKASQDNLPKFTKKALELPFLTKIGQISYGIYFYHLFAPDIFNYLKNHFPTTLLTHNNFKIVFIFITPIILAQLSWIIIEKPFIKLKSKFSYSSQ